MSFYLSPDPFATESFRDSRGGRTAPRLRAAASLVPDPWRSLHEVREDGQDLLYVAILLNTDTPSASAPLHRLIGPPWSAKGGGFDSSRGRLAGQPSRWKEGQEGKRDRQTAVWSRGPSCTLVMR